MIDPNLRVHFNKVVFEILKAKKAPKALPIGLKCVDFMSADLSPRVISPYLTPNPKEVMPDKSYRIR